jgi:hypothetical protein
MCIGKSVKVAGMDESEIGFEIFVNPEPANPRLQKVEK